MNRFWGDRTVRFFAATVCLAAVAFLSACVESARTVREAQAEFSRAAQVENRSLVGAQQGVQDSTEAATNYRMAATTMQKLIADKSGELKKDNLLCTAMTIEALSWWRLGDYDTALNIANNSSECSDATLPAGAQPARDLALFQALPGLIRIDQANRKLANPAQTIAEFNMVVAMLNKADDILQTARVQVGAGHPLELYLIQSQLAIVRNWQYAIERENLKGSLQDCEACSSGQQATLRLSELACASLTVPQAEEQRKQLLSYWTFVTGASVDKSVSSPNSQVCAHLNVAGGFPDDCQTEHPRKCPPN